MSTRPDPKPISSAKGHIPRRAHPTRNWDRSSPSKVDHQLSKKKSGPSVAERHCARSRPTTGRGNAWVQLKIIAPKRQNMSGSLGRQNLREKAATTADKLKCIGRWRSARNRTSRPLRGLAPIDVQTAMPRSRRHSSRNICRATSWNIIGDVRGVMSPGRAVSIPCWRRRGRPRANVRLATPLSHLFNIGDFFDR
jgi:hypothetical protein